MSMKIRNITSDKAGRESKVSKRLRKQTNKAFARVAELITRRKSKRMFRGREDMMARAVCDALELATNYERELG